MGRKERGEGCCAPFAGGGRKELGTHLTECGLAPSNTTSPGRGLPLYQVLSLSTSHFATTDTGQKLGGGALPPFGIGELGPHLTLWPGPRHTCMPSFILIHPTIWLPYTNVTDRQDRQTDRQRSNRIGRTVLQTVTQKLKPGLVVSYDIRPGNGQGLIWFQCFIILSLVYLLRHLTTYSPGTHMGLTADIYLSP